MGGHGAVKKTRWHTIDEIPDELIQTYSKRDPDNMIYQTRRWVNFKKKQLLFSQNDGVPNHLRTRGMRFMYYGIWTSTLGLFFYNFYMYNKVTSAKKN